MFCKVIGVDSEENINHAIELWAMNPKPNCKFLSSHSMEVVEHLIQKQQPSVAVIDGTSKLARCVFCYFKISLENILIDWICIFFSFFNDTTHKRLQVSSSNCHIEPARRESDRVVLQDLTTLNEGNDHFSVINNSLFGVVGDQSMDLCITTVMRITPSKQ